MSRFLIAALLTFFFSPTSLSASTRTWTGTTGNNWMTATLIVASLSTSANAQQKLLIVHADDLAVAHSVDSATIDALGTGLVTSASIMVPCPWLPEIAAWAKQHPDADLGLHLTLTSEWSPFRWRPLTSGKSLVDADGFFYATESEAAAHIDPKEAEAEIRAQIAYARAMGIRPTHLDSHMGTLYQNKELFEVFQRVAREENLPARITRTQADGGIIDQIISIGADVPAGHWRAWYGEQIRHLKPGVTEMIVHLGHDDAELRAITAGHPAWGAAWRQRDLDYVTSHEFRRVLRENDVHLVTWREVRKTMAPRVVFMGDSITEGWARFFASEFPGRQYINRGISGQTTPQMLARFQKDVIDEHPDAVVILGGINDIAGNTGPETLEMIEGYLTSMMESARANGIAVVLCSVLPANRFTWRPELKPAQEIIELNSWMKRYAAQHGVTFVDYHSAMTDEAHGLPPTLSPDGVHPNEAGYRIMAPLVEKGIATALGSGL